VYRGGRHVSGHDGEGAWRPGEGTLGPWQP
jgi:hypothetical protein